MLHFQPEDFIVEEIPLYEPNGTGTHTYFAIRKRNLSTYEAINRIASYLQVRTSSIGYAGLKDKCAITTQVLSVEGITPNQLLNLDIPSIEVLWAKSHQHKLRVGHLRGNKFTITLDDVSIDEYTDTKENIERIATEGLPNWFGKQRFGNKQDTHLIGKALVLGNLEDALAYIHGDETAQFKQYTNKIEKEKARNSLENAVMCIPHRLRRLYLSAYQAYLFNCLLEKRISNISQLWDGDIAVKHSNGAPFYIENALAEQQRSDDFEISPTGPIFGYKMRKPSGKMQLLEMQLLSDEGLKSVAFRKVTGIRLPGTRRPLRIQMELHQFVVTNDTLCLSFTLPAGGYATVVLDELINPSNHRE